MTSARTDSMWIAVDVGLSLINVNRLSMRRLEVDWVAIVASVIRIKDGTCTPRTRVKERAMQALADTEVRPARSSVRRRRPPGDSAEVISAVTLRGDAE